MSPIGRDMFQRGRGMFQRNRDMFRRRGNMSPRGENMFSRSEEVIGELFCLVGRASRLFFDEGLEARNRNGSVANHAVTAMGAKYIADGGQ